MKGNYQLRQFMATAVPEWVCIETHIYRFFPRTIVTFKVNRASHSEPSLRATHFLSGRVNRGLCSISSESNEQKIPIKCWHYVVIFPRITGATFYGATTPNGSIWNFRKISNSAAANRNAGINDM
jgi:hypothetical protein